MAPRPRDPPPAPGLLASAFSFVSREIGSFVTAAAGGEVQPKQPQREEQPQASSSRVTLDGKRRVRDEGRGDREREREKERKGKRVRKRSEVESERARARRRVRKEDADDSDDERDRALRALKKKVQPAPMMSRSTERGAGSADDEDDEPVMPPPPKRSAKKRRETVEEPRPAADVASVPQEPEAPPPKKKSEKSADKSSQLMPSPPTPSRPPPPRSALLATPAPTMPGSLFPRSASLMPETPAFHHRRAVPRPRTPPPVEPPIIEETEPEAVQSEHEESPRRGRTPSARSASRDRSADAARPTSARSSSRHSDASGRAGSSARRSFDEYAEPAPRARSSKGKERAYDTSGDIRVRGKEQELREAREEHARHAQDRGDSAREQDKLRIRMLEEEVARLRAELALKSSSMMPPPPPPPPPPPIFRAQAPTASSGGTENFLASARASLKHTEPPVEAPINSVAYGARTKKTGQPTVNVPSDKMAAFLREMKTVRLRRVGELTGNTSMGPPASTARGSAAEAGELSRSTSGNGMSRARMAATLGERSFDLGVAASLEIGAKRKRSAFEESTAGPSKRRETVSARRADTASSASSSQSLPSSSQSSASSSQSSSFSSSSAQTSSSRTNFFDTAPSRSQPSRPRTSAPLRIWPTGSTAETDLTTPSLCSDNENDPEHEEHLPDTPSDSGRNLAKGKEKSAIPHEREPKLEPQPEIIDVDALETPPRPAPAPKPAAAERKDLFARRPPASPLPAAMKSPDKPKPPARAAKSKIPLALPRRVPVAGREHGEESESDDPLAGPPSRPASRTRTYVMREDAPRAGPSRVRRDLESSPSPPARSRSRMGGDESRPESRMSNHARRRLTLDEEVRRAGDSLWQPSDEEGEEAGPPEEPEPDVDSGELVALGTRNSKRGFLARGGGAGAPVFMGEGYVEGAAAAEWLATRERSRSGTGESGSRRTAARR